MLSRLALIASVAMAPLALSACSDEAGGGGASRDQIRAVGSSTVYPFAKAMAEAFVAANSGFKSPIIESTGTGGGIKLFCAGVGAQHPDIANASRRMKKAEFELCQGNGVNEIIEIQVGVDGLAFAESNKGPEFKLTPKLIYEALAANPYGNGPNKAQKWSDLDPSLPNVAIQVFGPPSTSGTRDSLVELILEPGCDSDPKMKALKESNADEHKKLCTQVREDGKYADQGENDNLIVGKLASNPTALGIFGFSYLEENRGTIRDVPLNGVGANYETVSSGEYPGARPLYIYVKKAHVSVIPGLKEYLSTWTANWNPGGLLAKTGLVSSREEDRAKNGQVITNLTALDGSVLK